VIDPTLAAQLLLDAMTAKVPTLSFCARPQAQRRHGAIPPRPANRLG
jgi:hypothetical protein